jgi:hypothetical protein
MDYRRPYFGVYSGTVYKCSVPTSMEPSVVHLTLLITINSYVAPLFLQHLFCQVQHDIKWDINFVAELPRRRYETAAYVHGMSTLKLNDNHI